MTLTTVQTPETEEKVPVLARFATIKYDLNEPNYPVSPGMTLLPPEKTAPTTFSATTKHGDDNDQDDTGND